MRMQSGDVAFDPSSRDDCGRATGEWADELRTFNLSFIRVGTGGGNERCSLINGANAGKGCRGYINTA